MGLTKRIKKARKLGLPIPADAPPEDNTPRHSFIRLGADVVKPRAADTSTWAGALMAAAFVHGESQLVSLETSEQSARATVAANPQPGCDHYCLHQWQGVPTWGRWMPVCTILKPEISRG